MSSANKRPSVVNLLLGKSSDLELALKTPHALFFFNIAILIIKVVFSNAKALNSERVRDDGILFIGK